MLSRLLFVAILSDNKLQPAGLSLGISELSPTARAEFQVGKATGLVYVVPGFQPAGIKL
jgi:hypothetical protein